MYVIVADSCNLLSGGRLLLVSTIARFHGCKVAGACSLARTQCCTPVINRNVGIVGVRLTVVYNRTRWVPHAHHAK